MGFSKIWAKLISKKDCRVLLLGLDAAGKTTILYRFKLGEVVTTIPTIGFNVETIEYKNLRFTSYDVGGQDKIRPLWRYYYHGADAIIYVVDCADHDRIDESKGAKYSAKEELRKMLAEDELRDAHLLIFANKQDLPNAMKVSEVSERLGLAKLRSRQWYVQGCSAVTGDGLYEGLDWLSSVISKKSAKS
eukprot:TRINITY_DN9700_c0_g1_i1.p1 TRINITY_DN9700_c0_g1~~TRINITY_DN9700_c0_g1_i1.p1  ORF type:complete len:190 (-),score=54.47 TRINITY_DN9700_c0_g1_i1:135-704(-)